jgi:hypothetical protein
LTSDGAAMTAALLLTLDAAPVVNGARDARQAPAITAGDCERLRRLLDAHAMAATWLLDERVEPELIQAIGAMRAPQDVVRGPFRPARPGRGAALATRVVDAVEVGARLDGPFVGQPGGVGDWVPSPLRLAGFRGALRRAIRDGAVCHVSFRLHQLARRPRSIRLLEDLLFRVAEERRRGRIRVMTLADARRVFAGTRLIDAA